MTQRRAKSISNHNAVRLNSRWAAVPIPVRQRWKRRIYRKWGKNLARVTMRWVIPVIERKRRKALEEAFETCKHFALVHENGRMTGVSTLLNIGLYLLIAHRDIQAAKVDALTHPNEWSRKLNARIILLTIYEWDADKVSGRNLRKSMDQMLIPDELKQETSELLRRLRKIQDKANTKFSAVRNSAIAHRDPNALTQYRAIRDLNVQEVIDLAVEFFNEVNAFISVLTRLLVAGNTFQSYSQQWSASETNIVVEHVSEAKSDDNVTSKFSS